MTNIVPLKNGVFNQYRKLMIEQEKLLLQEKSIYDKTQDITTLEVFAEDREEKTLPTNNESVIQISKFVSTLANEIKSFSILFQRYAELPEKSEAEEQEKIKARNQLGKTHTTFKSLIVNLTSPEKEIATQIFYDMLAKSIKEYRVITAVMYGNKNLNLVGETKNDVSKLVLELNNKQHHARNTNSLSWLADEMYSYLYNAKISGNAKEYISQLKSKNQKLDSNSYEHYESNGISYSFSNKTTRRNFCSSRLSYFQSIVDSFPVDASYEGFAMNSQVSWKTGKRVQIPTDIAYLKDNSYKTYLYSQLYSIKRAYTLALEQTKSQDSEKNV